MPGAVRDVFPPGGPRSRDNLRFVRGGPGVELALPERPQVARLGRTWVVSRSISFRECLLMSVLFSLKKEPTSITS